MFLSALIYAANVNVSGPEKHWTISEHPGGLNQGDQQIRSETDGSIRSSKMFIPDETALQTLATISNVQLVDGRLKNRLLNLLLS